MSQLQNVITEPGIYDDVPETVYHSDPIHPASLSSSIAKLIVSRSPRHAWHEHPKLNPAKALDDEDKPTRVKEIGTVAHKLILGRGRDVQEITADDYKSKAAQQDRVAAYAAGRAPILSPDLEHALEIEKAAREQLAATEFANVFDQGKPEVTLVWRDRYGSMKRARVDWMPDAARNGGHITVVDLKTTGGTAASEDWQRTAFDMGYDIQDAFYREGLQTLIPGVLSVRFAFIVLEQSPPYGLTVNEFGGQALFEAVELVDMASRMWAACMKRGVWPSYAPETTHMDPPKWRSERGEYRKLAMQRRVEAWQAPLAIDAPAAD